MPAVVGQKSQPERGDEDVVHFVLRVHGAGAGDDVVAPRQRFGPDELQQQPRHGPAVVPEDDVAVGQCLHRTFIKDEPLGCDG